jgi:RimJ/RimL family protein N-acetyltransferase
MLTLETSRLHLRLFTPEDLENLHTLLSDPDVVKFTGTGKPVSLEETKTALDSILKH